MASLRVGSRTVKMRYFSIVAGNTVQRFGTPAFIGARRTATGMEFDPEKVVAIPADEVIRYTREYRNALRRGEISERTEEDWRAANREEAPSPKPEPEPEPEPEESSKPEGRRRRRSGGKGTEET